MAITSVEFYPESPSIGSGFIVVTRVDSAVSVRVPWMVPACSEAEGACFGEMPKSGSAFVCYFSNADPNATCGPSPFNIPGFEETFTVYALDTSGAAPQKLEKKVTTGSSQFNAHLQLVENASEKTIKVQVFMQLSQLGYVIYDESMVAKTSGTLAKNEYGTFIGDIPYAENYKFLVFSGNGTSGSAGAAYPVPKPAGSTGETNTNTTSQFNIQVDDVRISDAVVKQGGTFRHIGSKITNNGNSNVSGLAVSVPENMRRYLVITPEKTTLAPGEYTRMKVEVVNIQGHMEIMTTVNVTVNGVSVGDADINIKVSVIDGSGTASDPPTAVPAIIKGQYMTGKDADETVTVRNNHDSEIRILQVTSTELGTILTAELPQEPISPGGSASFDLTFNSASSGSKTGVITIETDSGSASVFADLVFYSNMSNTVDMAESRLDGALAGIPEAKQTTLSSVIDSIRSDLSSAQTKFDANDFDGATRMVEIADAKISMLDDVADVVSGSSGGGGGTTVTCDCDLDDTCDEDCWCDENCTPDGGGGGFDFTIIIIIAIVALGGFGAWYYFTKIRKTGWEGEVEDDF